MKIPIANIYYMLLYAWKRLEQHEVVGVSPEDENDLLDLLARVLAHGVERLLRRGLDREYVERTELISGVRGKLELAATGKSLALYSARSVCTFDELSYNVIQNQILRSTIQRLLRSRQVNGELQDELSGLNRRLHEIDTLDLRSEHFRSVRLHRNNAFYGFLLDVCRFIFDEWFPNEASGNRSFEHFSRDPKKMHSLFEEFIRNFYAIRAPDWREGRRSYAWQLVEGATEHVAYLPTLNTDVTLVRGKHIIILDAKYYGKTLSSYMGVERIPSSNVNQLFCYMRNMAICEPHAEIIEGVLIYPSVDTELDLTFKLHGHGVQVRTVDLSKPWQQIHERLLSFLPA